MTQNNNKPVVDLFDEAAKQMAEQGMAIEAPAAFQFRKPTLDVDRRFLNSAWAGRELITANFEIGTATQTKKKPVREMITSPYGGIFNQVGYVSVAGRPVAVNKIAGAVLNITLGDEELFLDTHDKENPVVVQSCRISNREAWKQIHKASKVVTDRAPQLVVVGAITTYRKGLVQKVTGGSGDSAYEYDAYCIAFEVVDWGIAFAGDEFWAAPPLDCTFLDGIKVVASRQTHSQPASSYFGALSRASKAKAAMAAALDPAAKLVVATNPVAEAKLSAELDAETPVKAKAKAKKTVKAKVYEPVEQQLDTETPFAVEDEEGMF